MRLLVLTDRLSAHGGADRHLAQVVQSAVAAGDQVTVAFGRDDRTTRPPEGTTGTRVRGLASRTAGRSRLGGLADLLDAPELVLVQNVMNPDALEAAAATGRAVITVQDHRVLCPGPGKTLPDGTACRQPMSDTACTACLPDASYRRATLELSERRLAAVRRCAAVVVLSSYMADELAAVGVDRAEVLPPWTEAGPARDAPGTRFVLGGRLVAHKGVGDGWQAWQAAGRPLPLTVVGAGPLEAGLDGTDRRGWLDPGPLARLLREARALLFPARWQEPFGILGVEALGQGTPVIVADSGGTRDWSDAGCLRVPPGDVTAMAAAIRRLADDPDLALELGRAGQRAVAARFSRERIEPRLRALHHRIARG
ncbi:MAG TPA: glycosyltransferase family 4 protein [Candidatus Sulfomarinibacteraceae bacterium]|nr:glycosyltransferase family 4 protein [Candidatus Sulfomarinibacteraceae bacterium]